MLKNKKNEQGILINIIIMKIITNRLLTDLYM